MLSRGLAFAALALLAAVAVFTPTPARHAEAANGVWTGDYFNNITLTAAPVLSRAENSATASDGTTKPCKSSPLPAAALTLDSFWTGSPGAGVNADGFSVRWQRTDTYAAGTYRFTGTTDDGMRIKVDGTTTVVDAWFDGWEIDDDAARAEQDRSARAATTRCACPGSAHRHTLAA